MNKLWESIPTRTIALLAAAMGGALIYAVWMGTPSILDRVARLETWNESRKDQISSLMEDVDAALGLANENAFDIGILQERTSSRRTISVADPAPAPK